MTNRYLKPWVQTVLTIVAIITFALIRVCEPSDGLPVFLGLNAVFYASVGIIFKWGKMPSFN